MNRFLMSGAAGRMGKSIIALSCNSSFSLREKIQLGGALEDTGSKCIGMDAGELSGAGMIGVPIVSDLPRAISNVNVVIDFSSPDASMKLAEICASNGISMVIGTTGFSEKQKNILMKYSEKIAILIEPNMSPGVNLMFYLAAEAARLIGEAYDVELVEAHHKFKKDAPSGTAERLKEILLKIYNRDESNVVYGRSGTNTERKSREIGIHAVRGGDTVGDHRLYFYGDGESLEISHRATSRNTFAFGALRAACFLAGSNPGLYSMKEVLDIN